jgi:hypothetical protein
MVLNKKLGFIVVSVSIITLLDGVEGWKMFHRGRGRGGMLGSPKAEPNITVPPAEWFVQLLDHFNPTVPRTWEQVSSIILFRSVSSTVTLQAGQCCCAEFQTPNKLLQCHATVICIIV